MELDLLESIYEILKDKGSDKQRDFIQALEVRLTEHYREKLKKRSS